MSGHRPEHVAHDETTPPPIIKKKKKLGIEVQVPKSEIEILLPEDSKFLKKPEESFIEVAEGLVSSSLFKLQKKEEQKRLDMYERRMS